MGETEPFILALKVVIIVFGIALCFFGWSIYKDMIKLFGGIVGFIVGVIIVITLGIKDILAFFIIILLTWIGSEILWKLNQVFTFMGGAIIGVLTYKLIFVSKSHIFDLSAIDIFFAITGGFIALSIHKFYVISFTTILGSGILSIIFGKYLFIPLIFFGFIIQYSIMTYFIPESKKDLESPRTPTFKNKLFGNFEENGWENDLFDVDSDSQNGTTEQKNTTNHSFSENKK